MILTITYAYMRFFTRYRGRRLLLYVDAYMNVLRLMVCGMN